MITSADILNADILIVDDKEVNVRLLEGMLRGDGYTSVHSTTDPREVCELHRKNQYDLILLDLRMPGMDGFQVMEALKEMEDDDYLPVLVITAQPEDKLRALNGGAKDFVSKPFDVAELRARVHNILEVRLLHLDSKSYTRTLKDSVRNLKANRQRELVSAQETQTGLLPRFLPQSEDYRVHAVNQPTRCLGGNFYDFLQSGSGGLTGVVADVSGSGTTAALLSSMIQGALSMELRSGAPPQESFRRLNQVLYGKSLPPQFLKLFLFTLAPDGSGQFIGAACNPAYVFRAATGTIEKLVSDAHVLGMFEAAAFESRPFRLDKGDILVIYSDGLVDANNPQEETFGAERLREIILRNGASGSDVVEQQILHDIETFRKGTMQTDDITFVSVEKRR